MRAILGTLLMAGLLAGCGGVEGDVEPLMEQEQELKSYTCDDNANCPFGLVCCGDLGGPRTCMSTCVSTS